MPRAVCIYAHPDDELYTMWPMMHLLACGYRVEFVPATRGEVTPASLRLDPDPAHYSGGIQPACTWPSHGYKHDPAREGFVLPTKEQIGLARLAETTSCVGAMAAIPPYGVPGVATVHDMNMGSQYGCGGCGSSTAAVVPAAIDAAEAMIREKIAEFPNSFFYTHSPTDDHPDHAALGLALRRLKGSPVYHSDTQTFTFTGGDPVLAPLLVNAMFFVSKLYWGGPNNVPPRPADVLAEYCGWYPNIFPKSNVVLERRSEYTAWLRNKVALAYTSWNPAQGSFAIGGGHSTYSQMFSCILNPDLAVVSALWHP